VRNQAADAASEVAFIVTIAWDIRKEGRSSQDKRSDPAFPDIGL
jgi:hypothetical protein